MGVKTSYIGSFCFNIYFICIGMEWKDPELNESMWLLRHLTCSSFLLQCNRFVNLSPYHTFKEEIIPILSPGATQHIVGVYFTALYRALASSRTRLLDHIQRRTTVGRTPLNE
jgi:hypothetical protein